MYSDLSTAINQIGDLEQYTCKNSLEIHGIPESTNENLAENITLGNALNVSICHDDINIWHRLLSSRSSTQPKPMILRFKWYKARKALYSTRKHLKNLNLEELFDSTDIIYFNENLTTMQHTLFSIVWKRKKLPRWHGAWTIDGKIFFKKHVDNMPSCVYNSEDLDNVWLLLAQLLSVIISANYFFLSNPICIFPSIFAVDIVFTPQCTFSTPRSPFLCFPYHPVIITSFAFVSLWGWEEGPFQKPFKFYNKPFYGLISFCIVPCFICVVFCIC